MAQEEAEEDGEEGEEEDEEGEEGEEEDDDEGEGLPPQPLSVEQQTCGAQFRFGRLRPSGCAQR